MLHDVQGWLQRDHDAKWYSHTESYKDWKVIATSITFYLFERVYSYRFLTATVHICHGYADMSLTMANILCISSYCK